MPHVNEYGFGPGSMEGLRLKVWVSKVDNGHKRATARLEGTYTAYCGRGWEHEVQVKEDETHWSSENTNESMQLFELLHEWDTVDTKHDVGHRLLDFALEDWFDPCELEGEL